MTRDIVLSRRYWKATTFSSTVQPTIYLLAFGLGFRSLVSHVGHVRYVEYVGTGVVATAVLFSSAFPGMFNTFIRLAVTAHLRCAARRPGRRRGTGDRRDPVDLSAGWRVRGGAADRGDGGLEPTPGMLLVPLIGFLTGFGFAAFGVVIAPVAKTIDNANYVTSAMLTPMFLVAGTFFPISNLPSGVRTVAQFNPSTTASRRCATSPWGRSRRSTSSTPPYSWRSRWRCGAWPSGGSDGG